MSLWEVGLGILGDEYKELRTDSKAFMEKLTKLYWEKISRSQGLTTKRAAPLHCYPFPVLPILSIFDRNLSFMPTS